MRHIARRKKFDKLLLADIKKYVFYTFFLKFSWL